MHMYDRDPPTGRRPSVHTQQILYIIVDMICMHIHTSICVYLHTRKNLCIYIYVYVYTYVYEYIFMFIHDRDPP